MNMRMPHPTKRGPGRRHKQGQPHGSKPIEAKGAPAGFVRHTNPEKNKRRKTIKMVGGIRQFNKAVRAGDFA